MIIFKNLILKISSLRFAISLIIFIAIASGIGTFIPQRSNKNFYIENFDSTPIFGFLNGEKVLKLQLEHVYTSFWFLFTLILLCTSSPKPSALLFEVISKRFEPSFDL